jgi:minor extracellular serine protease Vpr
MATPHVAGAAALLLELFPSWTPDDVRSALLTRSISIGQDAVTQGSGRIVWS